MLIGSRGRMTKELQLKCRKPLILLESGRDSGWDADVVSEDVPI